MPALSNAKHELFAQHVANGKSLDDAYSDIGFLKKNRGNPSRLRNRIDVDSRIREILEEKAQKSIQQYGAEIEYSRERLLGYLEEARSIAKDKDNPVGVTQATVAMARILGLIIDRREVGDVGAFDGMTDDELVREATKKAQELGVPHLKLVDDEDESAA